MPFPDDWQFLAGNCRPSGPEGGCVRQHGKARATWYSL